MARSRSPAPREKPRLEIPLEQARAELEPLVAQGQQLLSQTPSSRALVVPWAPDALNERRRQVNSWADATERWLDQRFTSSELSDTFWMMRHIEVRASGYGGRGSGNKPRICESPGRIPAEPRRLRRRPAERPSPVPAQRGDVGSAAATSTDVSVPDHGQRSGVARAAERRHRDRRQHPEPHQRRYHAGQPERAVRPVVCLKRRSPIPTSLRSCARR